MKKILVVSYSECRGQIDYSGDAKCHSIIEADSLQEGYIKYCKSFLDDGEDVQEVIDFNKDWLEVDTEHSMLFQFEESTLILEVMD